LPILRKVLTETGLNPNYLEIEITEQSIMEHQNMAAEILQNLKTLGVKIAIDHFGIGYTSISHLKLLPIGILKIDQSFIKGISNNPNDMAITNAFISLAHHLGLEIIAEGVETAEQIEYLAAQNCDIVQGYYLSHPLPAPKIILQFRKLMDKVLI
jgi:EAL domain-containing protein (putative c-di-GMP-specific phosphodiesterase class I)